MPPKFLLHIQETILRILLNPLEFLYGTITLYGLLFQKSLSVQVRTKKQSYNTTFPLYYYKGFGLPYSAFSRSYLQNLY